MSQLTKIKRLVASGIKEGAKLYQPECVLPKQGYYFRPTLFTGVTQSHRVAREEIFGPVLSVLTFRTVDDAIEKANNTLYGLSAGVWTAKGARILKMAAELKAGVVWANTFNKFDPSSPFGGYKEATRLRKPRLNITSHETTSYYENSQGLCWWCVYSFRKWPRLCNERC